MEFFRGPKIVVVPQINTDSDITFQEPNEVERYEGDYAQLMREYMWCSVVETPAFAYYTENGYLSSEDLNKMRAKRNQLIKQLDRTFAKVPLKVHLKNNGFQATTIESVNISIPTIQQNRSLGATIKNENTHIEPSKVDDLNYTFTIPVAYLMHGEMIDFVKKLTTESPDTFKNAVVDTAGTQLAEAGPFISFDSKGTVVVTDQYGTQYTGTFDLRPISELLEKARPPESREQKTTKETKRQ